VLLALAGGVVIIVMTVLLSLENDYTVALAALTALVLGLGGVTCLGGVRLVRSRLIRTGLYFQLGALASTLVLAALLLFLYLAPYQPSFDTLYSVAEVYLALLVFLPGATGLVMISYGVVPWQRRDETRFTVLQVVGSGLAALLLLITVDFQNWFDLGGSPLLLWVLLTAGVFAQAVFWLRPGCWKRTPAATLLLAVGAGLLLVQTPAVYSVLSNWAGADAFPAWYRAVALCWLCLLLGCLVLIQTERVRQQQSAVASPALGVPSGSPAVEA
jgi:hypothetical protein